MLRLSGGVARRGQHLNHDCVLCTPSWSRLFVCRPGAGGGCRGMYAACTCIDLAGYISNRLQRHAKRKCMYREPVRVATRSRTRDPPLGPQPGLIGVGLRFPGGKGGADV